MTYVSGESREFEADFYQREEEDWVFLREGVEVLRVEVEKVSGKTKSRSLGEAWVGLDLVCDRGDGEHLDPDGFSHAFERFVTRAGLPAMRLHDLRHATRQRY